jgi:predicted nucleotidyltransferase
MGERSQPVPSQVHEQDVLARAVEALRDGLGDRLVAVALFGSRARGEAGEESDWDLLVVAEGLPTSPLQRQLSLKKLLPPGCEAVSLLLRTPEEFGDHVSSLYLEIALDGRILHDPRGYLAERLGQLRRFIEDAGVYRERTSAGGVWFRKHRPPGRENEPDAPAQ